MRIGRATGTPGSFFEEWTHDNSRAVPATERARRHRAFRRPSRAGSAAILIAVSAAVVTALLPSTSASADPSSTAWYRLRMCESGNNYATNTGNGHYGAYQFDLGTWRSVGGSGYPYRAGKAEQDARALILYRMRGWQPWECATILGLREDADARSGRTSDIRIGAPTTAVPAFPGTRAYHYGDWNSNIKRFQDQMHGRGFFPVGTGEFGPNTLRMVKQLQRLNGFVASGNLGPGTWRLAWTGKYVMPSVRATAPAFPGSRWYYYGDNNTNIKRFQNQMHRRGYFPAGTGQYGPKTLRMVKQLQRLNGLVPNGYIGPNTWQQAWIGRYTPPQ